MEYTKYYLFISNIINLISIFSTSYLYSEYNKTFQNIKRISINLSFEDFSGFLLYAIDSKKNRLLIRTEKFNETKEISFNLNGYIYKKSVVYYSGSINHFEVIMKIDKSGLKYDQNKENFEIFFPKVMIPDPFANYPVPQDFDKVQNKTYIWMGNIGPYNGINGRKYEPFTNTGFACLNHFYINYIPIEFLKESKQFSKSCIHMYNDSFCNKDQCKVIQLSENFLNCSIYALNTNIMCYKDLSRFEYQSKTFEKTTDLRESTSFKIVWKQNQLNKFCLAEIDMKDGSHFIFYINKKNELSHCFMNHSLAGCFYTKFMFNVTSNVIHVLMITFEYSHIIIKISNGKYIHTFKNASSTNIKILKIGHSKLSDNCVPFQGELTFRYDLSQFKSTCILQMSLNFSEFYILISSGYAITMTILCVALFINFMKFKVKVLQQKCKKESPYSTNNYETTEIQNISLRSLPVPYQEEQNNHEFDENQLYAQVAERTETENSVYDYTR